MSYCRLLSAHKSISFPDRPRTELVIPISERELFILLKDQSYICYDSITQLITFEGILPSPKFHKHHILDSNSLMFIYTNEVVVLNIKVNTCRKYSVTLDTNYTQLLFLEDLGVICILVERANTLPTVLIQYWLDNPDKTQTLELNHSFIQPLMLQMAEEELLLVSFVAPTLYTKHYNILKEEHDLVEMLATNTLLDIEVLSNCFFKEGVLMIFGNKKGENKLFHYDFSTNTVLSVAGINRDTRCLILLVEQVRNHFAIFTIDPGPMTSHMILMDGNGKEVDRVNTKKLSLEGLQVAMNRAAVFYFEYTNEKSMQKVKADVPTLVKYLQVRVASKKSLYFKLIKNHFPSEGEGFWRHVLDSLT